MLYSHVTEQLGVAHSHLAKVLMQYGTSPSSLPDIIAVCKTQPTEAIIPLLEVGHQHFGENRIQEVLAKWPTLKVSYPDALLHFLGSIQTNKVKDVVTYCDVIHTIDREKLAIALRKEMEKQEKWPLCFIQVNTGEEEQKGGILPAEAEDFIVFCQQEVGLPVKGLMCIPPVEDDPAPHFALLRTIAEQHQLSHLSMGMSKDYTIAAALGATFVRLGAAIFGERN